MHIYIEKQKHHQRKRVCAHLAELLYTNLFNERAIWYSPKFAKCRRTPFFCFHINLFSPRKNKYMSSTHRCYKQSMSTWYKVTSIPMTNKHVYIYHIKTLHILIYFIDKILLLFSDIIYHVLLCCRTLRLQGIIFVYIVICNTEMVFRWHKQHPSLYYYENPMRIIVLLNKNFEHGISLAVFSWIYLRKHRNSR